MKRNIIIKLMIAAAAVLTVGMMSLAAGCSKPDDSRQPIASDAAATAEATEPQIIEIDVPNVQGAKQSAGNLTVFVPDGWRFVPGGPGGKENDDSVFVYSGDEQGAPYIWVQKQTMGNIQSSVSSSTTDEIAPFSINGVVWQGKAGAFYGEPGGELYIIMLHPTLRYDDDNVIAVVGSLCGA